MTPEAGIFLCGVAVGIVLSLATTMWVLHFAGLVP